MNKYKPSNYFPSIVCATTSMALADNLAAVRWGDRYMSHIIYIFLLGQFLTVSLLPGFNMKEIKVHFSNHLKQADHEIQLFNFAFHLKGGKFSGTPPTKQDVKDILNSPPPIKANV